MFEQSNFVWFSQSQADIVLTMFLDFGQTQPECYHKRGSDKKNVYHYLVPRFLDFLINTLDFHDAIVIELSQFRTFKVLNFFLGP